MPPSNLAYLTPYYQHEFAAIANSGETYKGRWNWPAFLFGSIWLLTKGAWLAALLHFVVNLTIILMTCGFGVPIVLVSGFILGLRGNYIYYSASQKDQQLPT